MESEAKASSPVALATDVFPEVAARAAGGGNIEGIAKGRPVIVERCSRPLLPGRDKRRRTAGAPQVIAVALSFCRLLGFGCPKKAFAKIATLLFVNQPNRAEYMKHIEKWIIAFVFCLTAGFANAEAIDVNTANAADIAKALNGIGITKAEAIVKDRETNGPFKTVDDLARVKGIGPATLTKNKDLIIVK